MSQLRPALFHAIDICVTAFIGNRLTQISHLNSFRSAQYVVAVAKNSGELRKSPVLSTLRFAHEDLRSSPSQSYYLRVHLPTRHLNPTHSPQILSRWQATTIVTLLPPFQHIVLSSALLIVILRSPSHGPGTGQIQQYVRLPSPFPPPTRFNVSL